MLVRVSILIPAHNAEPWIQQTLQSALAQSWANCEVIVVDDGSVDATLRIARGYEPRIQVISQSKRGASAARNIAMQAATGDFFQFLDADDLLTPDKIQRQVEALITTQDPTAVASCRWARFTSDPSLAEFVDTEVFRDFEPIDFLVRHTRDGKMMHPAAWLVPRLVAARAGPWDERLSLNDDGEYFARVLVHASRIKYSPFGASLYRSSLPGSLSGRKDRRALESLFESVSLISEHIRQRHDTAPVRLALANYWQRAAYEFYPEAPDLSKEAQNRATSYGGSTLEPALGRRQRQLARFIGWKMTRRLARLIRS